MINVEVVIQLVLLHCRATISEHRDKLLQTVSQNKDPNQECEDCAYNCLVTLFTSIYLEGYSFGKRVKAPHEITELELLVLSLRHKFE